MKGGGAQLQLHLELYPTNDMVNMQCDTHTVADSVVVCRPHPALAAVW